MIKGLRGALLAPLFGALLLVGTPSATFAAPPQRGEPPEAGKDPNAGKDPKPGDGNDDKDGKPGDGKDGDRRDSGHDDHWDRRYDRGDGHYDRDRYGSHGHHSWDTHRRYYRYGYRGPGWYDDCGYYGDGDSNGYYDSPDACDWQYGPDGASLRANLSGDEEVPGPGAPNAVGIANVFVDTGNGRLCYRLGYDGINRPSAAHIHRGGPGQEGPPVIDLHPEVNGDEGCVGADPTALRNVQDHPEAFYLNLHTPEYPDGAMRGQLFRTGRY
ncbi:MAG TPA: CHRD domain-containing protein [Acidimicrobiia bacterium]|nr:CHRD domain-containing protein [Acidimicrobiia bacterium]